MKRDVIERNRTGGRTSHDYGNTKLTHDDQVWLPMWFWALAGIVFAVLIVTVMLPEVGA